MYIQRTSETEIRKYLEKREIIAIVGPRQCGKTTLLKQLFEGLSDAIFLDFEDRTLVALFTEDIKAFIELYVKPYKYLFIDEFQYAKKGGQALKFIYDNHPIKIIISGSSISDLSVQGIKYLVGRIFVFNLYPFSFEEFLQYKDPKLLMLVHRETTQTQVIMDMVLPYMEEFCRYGGYPRVVMASTHEEKETILHNIYNTYLLKEIRDILMLPDDFKLSKLMNALALRMSSLTKYHELSAIVGMQYLELQRNINVLEKTFVIRRSRPFFTNKGVELVKEPKVFFIDNGFRNSIIKDFRPLNQRSDKGELYENFVATELMKKGYDLKFWRTKSKAEVDFIVEHQGQVIPLEIKSHLKITTFSKSYASFLDKYKPKKGYILAEAFWDDKKMIHFRPIYMAGKIFDRVN